MNKKGTIKRVGKILIGYLHAIYDFIDSNANEIVFVICFIASLLAAKAERFIMITILFIFRQIMMKHSKNYSGSVPKKRLMT